MFTLGVDFGTNSVRALVVRCSDGAEYRQTRGRIPFRRAGRSARSERRPLGASASRRLSVRPRGEHQRARSPKPGANRDFDPSKVARDRRRLDRVKPDSGRRQNRPLALSAKWKGDLNAQCWLWKDHTSWREAAKITELCAKLRPQYIAKCGGVYSSEWFWAKLWHCLNVAPETFAAAFSWVELADWVAVRARRRRRPATGQTGGLRRRSQGALFRRLGRPSGQGVPDRARPAPRRA